MLMAACRKRTRIAQDLWILSRSRLPDPLILPLVLSLSKGSVVLHPSRLPQTGVACICGSGRALLQQCFDFPNQYGKIGTSRTHFRGRNTMLFDLRWNMLVMRMGTLQLWYIWVGH